MGDVFNVVEFAVSVAGACFGLAKSPPMLPVLVLCGGLGLAHARLWFAALPAIAYWLFLTSQLQDRWLANGLDLGTQRLIALLASVILCYAAFGIGWWLRSLKRPMISR